MGHADSSGDNPCRERGLPEKYFGNGAKGFTIVLSWDLLLEGDVVAVAEAVRAQLSEVCAVRSYV